MTCLVCNPGGSGSKRSVVVPCVRNRPRFEQWTRHDRTHEACATCGRCYGRQTRNNGHTSSPLPRYVHPRSIIRIRHFEISILMVHNSRLNGELPGYVAHTRCLGRPTQHRVRGHNPGYSHTMAHAASWYITRLRQHYSNI